MKLVNNLLTSFWIVLGCMNKLKGVAHFILEKNDNWNLLVMPVRVLSRHVTTLEKPILQNRKLLRLGYWSEKNYKETKGSKVRPHYTLFRFATNLNTSNDKLSLTFILSLNSRLSRNKVALNHSSNT